MLVEFTKSLNSDYFNMCFMDSLFDEVPTYHPYIIKVAETLKERFDSFDRLNESTSVRFRFTDKEDEAAFLFLAQSGFSLDITL